MDDPDPEVLDLLRNEAHLYETNLKNLQGICIPRFYGLYAGTVDDRQAVCLLLEDCMEPLKDDPPMELRYAPTLHLIFSFCNAPHSSIQTIEALLAVHKAGIKQGDFVMWNTVVDTSTNPPRVVLVDFDNATPHVCPRTTPIMLYAMRPSLQEFPCQELWDRCNQLEIWTPGWLSQIRFF